MSDTQAIVSILLRYSRKEPIDVRERAILAAWLESSESNQRLFDEISDSASWQATIDALRVKDESLAWSLIEKRVASTGGFAHRPAGGLLTGWRKYAAAAAFAAGLVLLAEFVFKQGRKPVPPADPAISRTDILTGTGHAILTLGSSRPVALDSAGIAVLRDNEAFAAPVSADSASFGGSANTGLSRIETPKGGTFRIGLGDGTRVWLNTASSLSFPSNFGTRGERIVNLTGEAYFEVKKDPSRPFVVRTGGASVRVLGTHFDVASYDNFQSVLLEGSVRITRERDSILLKPGEIGRISPGGDLVVEAADTARAMAWRRNMFWFQQATYREIMTELSRWYPMTISYEGDVAQRFSGILPRDKSLRQLLKILEGGGHVSFSIEGDRVTVKALR